MTPPKKIKAKKIKASLPVRIEQAIALGRSPDWMIEHLGVTDQDIDDAMRRIDTAYQEDADGLPPVPCGTVKGYNRHVHRHQPPCTRCKAAYNQACRERRTRQRAARVALPAGDITRPLDSYYGPAPAGVIDELIDALNGAA